MDTLKKILSTAVIVAILFGLGILIIDKISHKQTTKDNIQEQILISKIDSANKVINSLKDSISSANNTIASLNNLSNFLMQKYKSQKNEIKKNDNRLVIKNNAVDTLNSVELASAITDRYK